MSDVHGLDVIMIVVAGASDVHTSPFASNPMDLRLGHFERSVSY